MISFYKFDSTNLNNEIMSATEWGWIDDPEDEVEYTCKMCDAPMSRDGYCSTECFEADLD